MIAVTVLAYVADAWIIGTYAIMARRPERARWFHLANAIGCLPLIGVEAATGAWAVSPVTFAFGIIGWYGVVKDRRPRAAEPESCVCGWDTRAAAPADADPPSQGVALGELPAGDSRRSAAVSGRPHRRVRAAKKMSANC